VTSCALARTVWVVKLTVTDLPVAAGTRSAAATENDTPVTWPPIIGRMAPPERSNGVLTAKLLLQAPVRATVFAGMVAPVRVRV